MTRRDGGGCHGELPYDAPGRRTAVAFPDGSSRASIERGHLFDRDPTGLPDLRERSAANPVSAGSGRGELLRLESLARELERAAVLRHRPHDGVRVTARNVRLDLERDLRHRTRQRRGVRSPCQQCSSRRGPLGEDSGQRCRGTASASVPSPAWASPATTPAPTRRARRPARLSSPPPVLRRASGAPPPRAILALDKSSSRAPGVALKFLTRTLLITEERHHTARRRVEPEP